MARARKSVVCRGEQGYILITLLLFVALLAIAMTALAPVISQQIKRDREEELIHRGVQYSRAIQHYVKKFGRYPTRIEDLENTNNVRFLRKRYKDPITGKDFRILHLGDVQMSFGPGIAGATPVGSLTGGNNLGAGGNFGGFGNTPSFGGGPFGNSGPGGVVQGGNTFGSSGFGNSGFGNTGFGNTGFGNTGFGNNPGQVGVTGANQAQTGAPTPDNGSDVSPNQPGSPGTPAAGLFNQPGQAGAGTSGTGSGNQTFGGGPMVGVASTSKEKTIRTFNKKDKYYQWQFIYDPSRDRGGLLTTPNQPGLQQAQGALQPGAPGSPGTQPSGFGSAPLQPGPGSGMQPGQQPSPFGSQPQVPQMPPDQGP